MVSRTLWTNVNQLKRLSIRMLQETEAPQSYANSIRMLNKDQ